MKLVLVQLLLSLVVVRDGLSKPVGGQTRSSCLRFNPYTFEVYMTMVNKPRDYQQCIDQDYNDNYCLANSILTLNLVQTPKKEKPPVTGPTLSTTAATSGSGAPQSNAVNDLKCRFNVNFEFKDEGHVLGGDIQLYNHAQSNDHYEVIVYNYTTKDEMIQIKSAEFDVENEAGWNTIQLNDFFSLYGQGKFELHILMQFIRNNEEISCDEAQTVFTTNCSKTQVNPPAAVIMSQRGSALNRLNKRSTQQASDCQPLPSEDLSDSLTRSRIPICEDYGHSGNRPCMAKGTKDIITTENEDENVAVINILPAVTVQQSSC